MMDQFEPNERYAQRLRTKFLNQRVVISTVDNRAFMGVLYDVGSGFLSISDSGPENCSEVRMEAVLAVSPV